VSTTARCLNCRLIQFVTERNSCRRCHVVLVPEEPKEPAALPAALPVPSAFDMATTVRKLRDERHLTQKDLAYRMCVNRSFVAKVESGKHMPDLSTLFRLASALQVDASFILDRCQNRSA
jgi:DNA-binding XRE family transcriptional regulator